MRHDNITKDLHKSILKLDAHVDIEVTFMTEERPGVLGYDKLVSWDKMKEGDLNGAFFAIYSEQPKPG
ncbi:hypothetical protein KJ708_03130, partial [bacterium]|nr:hypothetical protein [bacterium]